jgi:hypothetical protein
MIMHTYFTYKKKKFSENENLFKKLMDKKNYGAAQNWKWAYEDGGFYEYIEDDHGHIPMIRILNKDGMPSTIADDGIDLVEGWISSSVFAGHPLNPQNFKDLTKRNSSPSGAFICVYELEKFITYNKITHPDGFKKALRASGYGFVENKNIEFIHDPQIDPSTGYKKWSP